MKLLSLSFEILIFRSKYLNNLHDLVGVAGIYLWMIMDVCVHIDVKLLL